MAQQLIVEGLDAIVLANVMKNRGLPPPKGYGNPVKFRNQFVRMAGGFTKAMAAFQEALDNPSLSNIGLVVDANDAGADARWQAVQGLLRKKLEDEFVNSISLMPEGIIISAENFPVTGIWIMPDNHSAGYLEHFVAKMVPEEDNLWPYAEQTVADLESRGFSRFAAVKSQKALLHTWLSWQPEPGRPFGLAVEMGYLDAHSSAMDAFTQWFEKVFELEGE